MKLGAAPEIDRHTLQLSEPCRCRNTMAVSLRVTKTLSWDMAVSRRPQAAQIALA